MKLSVVIPTLGFEPALPKTVTEILTKLPKDAMNSTEIVIVYTPRKEYDGEDMKSIEYLEGRFPGLIRTIVESEPGYGVAYITGFAEAKGDFVLTLDADLTYPLDALGRMLKAAEILQLDFINTDRLADHLRGAFHWSHGVGNRLLAIIMNSLFGTGFKDSMSGMWLIRRSKIDAFQFDSKHWPFSMEIKVEARLRGLRCGEIPIHYRPRRTGESTISRLDGLRVAIFIIAKRFGFAGIVPIK